MRTIKYRTCRAHAGFLVHAVPVRESDPTKCGARALCGKSVNESRRPVWYIDGRPVTCQKCLNARAKTPPTYEHIEAKS